MSRFISQLYTLQSLLYLALILALGASLNHVAYAFSTVNGGGRIEAYISAIAIDIGLLALAAGINTRKQQGRKTAPLWAGVVLFSLVSIYANWLAGITHLAEIELKISSEPVSFSGYELNPVSFLVNMRPVLLSGVLPILVIYLSEIVSGNHQQAQIEAQKEAKKAQKRGQMSRKIGADDTNSKRPDKQTDEERLAHLEEANRSKEAKIEARRAQVLSLAKKGMSQNEIASELKGHGFRASLSTIKRDFEALNGQIKEGQNA